MTKETKTTKPRRAICNRDVHSESCDLHCFRRTVLGRKAWTTYPPAELVARQKVRRLRQKRRPLTRVEGSVWCDKHGCIHEDSLDPYEYGPAGLCDPRDHFAVYARHEDPR